jgi:peptidoglycan/LPS O-acetylase OafA/YrhL
MVSGTKLPALGRYFLNRALRILPAYLAIVLFVALVAGVAYTRPAELGEASVTGEQPVGYLTDPLVLFSNLFMVQTLIPEAIKTGIPAAWSLTVEMVFYIVMPLLALAAFKLSRRARVIPAAWSVMPIAAMLITGIAGKSWYSQIANPTNAAESYWLEWGGNWTAVLARSFLNHADLFAFGMAAALVLCLHESGRISLLTLQRIRWSGLACGASCVALAWKLHLANSGFALLAGALILFIAAPATAGDQGKFAQVLNLKAIVAAGTISYSAYLWHIPVILVLQKFSLTLPDTIPGWIGNTLIVIALTAALSTVTYRFIEKPAEALKKRVPHTHRQLEKVNASSAR